jgi:hypothetical protein
LYAALLSVAAMAAQAQTQPPVPDPEKGDDRAQRQADNPLRRIIEDSKIEGKARKESDAPAPKRATPPARARPTARASRYATPAASAPAVALTPATPTTPATEHLWASFNGATAEVEGASVQDVLYAEIPGDAALHDVTVTRDGLLKVTGQFSVEGGSRWAGAGIVITAKHPVAATGYNALNVRLASTTTDKLRVRMVGNKLAVQQAGCYPVLMVPVKPKVTEYRIEVSRFAAPSYCGKNGVDAKSTLAALTAIEITDSTEPVDDHAVNFKVGSLFLVK